MNAIERHHMEAAKRFAAAEPSDPFLLARIVAHMKNGVAGYRTVEPFVGLSAHYYAKETQEPREYLGIDGERKTYIATGYNGRRRP